MPLSTLVTPGAAARAAARALRKETSKPVSPHPREEPSPDPVEPSVDDSTARDTSSDASSSEMETSSITQKELTSLYDEVAALRTQLSIVQQHATDLEVELIDERSLHQPIPKHVTFPRPATSSLPATPSLRELPVYAQSGVRPIPTVTQIPTVVPPVIEQDSLQVDHLGAGIIPSTTPVDVLPRFLTESRARRPLKESLSKHERKVTASTSKPEPLPNKCSNEQLQSHLTRLDNHFYYSFDNAQAVSIYLPQLTAFFAQGYHRCIDSQLKLATVQWDDILNTIWRNFYN
ncbi:hypothetical protein PROFUN_00213 [Planoprotostelium fungivorum]|uniref:Uncharacterized protein n=1 Tax=Planoprotostelium fungivorum TaxID=1890364 RepID=A0A2P6NXR7_9EUKA|nr:hypothetical protein PROFUN_00213 [Planoprotostelium fungivorum]